MTMNEYLSEQIGDLSLKLAQFRSENDLLAKALQETTEILNILSEHLKSERNLLVAVIDGEDAEILADFFGKRLEGITE